MIIEEMDVAIEKESEYTSLIQEASTAYLNEQYTKALSKYNDSLVLSTEVKASKMTITILKYMVCLCLLQSNNLKDLAEAVMIMQTVEKSLKDRFPNIYCLLAKAHCKLYRFDQAVAAINEGTAVYKSNPLLETFYIPGTNIPIKHPDDEEIWLKIKEECLTWHKPDAVCSLTECCNITAPYVTANKNIFMNPAFTGMVVVHCNNKKRPCSLKFHQSCWKFKKDQMYPIKKVSDKDILGNYCFTPNCLNDNIRCIISGIEVVGPNGEVKAHMKESTSVPWPVNKSISKGAIKKIKPITPKSQNDPPKTMKYPVTVRQDIFIDKQKSCNTYEDDQILAVKDEIADVDFSSDPPEIAGEESFLFSLFHNYIQNNLVRVCDVYKKFTEIRDDLQLKDLDIMQFLIQTNKIEVLSNKPDQTYLSSSDNQESFNKSIKTERIEKVNLNKTIDLDDMYNELMNDDYDYFEMTDEFTTENQNSNIKSQQNTEAKVDGLHENYSSNASNTNFGYDQGSRESLQNTKSIPNNNYKSYNFPYEQCINESEKKTSENQKLKEEIVKLDLEMKGVLDKLSGLTAELKIKDAQIITLMKEQEEYSIEMDKVCENMQNFQKRYDEIKEENLNMKKEMINILREKKSLEEKLLEIDNRDTKKQDLMKMFQEEYKILEEHINSDWKEKTDKIQKALEDHIRIKNVLLDKCLNYQYSGHRYALKGHHDQCTTALEIINQINLWMETTLSIKNFLDNTEWLTRLSSLNSVISKHQNDYCQILEALHSGQIKDIDGINITLPHIPNPPPVSLSQLVQNALNTFYKGQCHVMQSAMKLQQQSMAYQMPPMQVNNGSYNQYHPQYPYGAQYSHPRPPVITNSLMAPPLLNFQMQRMNIPPPQVIPQNYASPVRQLHIDSTPNCNDKKSIDSTSNNTVPDTSNSENVTSKLEDLTIKEVEINNEVKQEKKEENVQKKEMSDWGIKKVVKERNSTTEKKEEKEQIKEKTVNDIGEKIKQSIDQMSIRNEKMAQMKKACKAIALQIQQKNTLDNSDDETNKRLSNKNHVDERKNIESKKHDREGYSNKQVSDENHVEDGHSNIDTKENVETNSLQLACINSVSNSAVNSSEENTTKQRKKIGIDGLIKMMKQKYPEALDIEIIETISDIRRRHNNSLSRLPINTILQESDEYMKQKHSLHTLRYIKNEGVKSNHDETSTKASGFNQNEKKTIISPASSSISLSKLEASPAQKKKTWNKITQDEIQWTTSGEIECSICMNLVTKLNCYTLSCRHSFHKQCIKLWLKSDRSCPNCRIAVTEDDEFPPLPA